MSPLLAWAFLALLAIAIVVPAWRRAPGLGVVAALALIALWIWQTDRSLLDYGFAAPANWSATILIGLLAGLVLAFLGLMVIDPVVERLTGHPHDISVVDGVRGNLANLALILALVWLTVAFLEEFLYRGFLMTELAALLGNSPAMLALNLLLTSALFGLSHAYQGPSGLWSTGILGALLGLLLIGSGFNLWLPIIAHGMIDSVQLTLIYFNWDERLKQSWIPPDTS